MRAAIADGTAAGEKAFLARLPNVDDHRNHEFGIVRSTL